MADLHAVTNRTVDDLSDSSDVLARVIAELMPAGFHIDGTCGPAADAYALLRRLADAKAPHHPISGSNSRRCPEV